MQSLSAAQLDLCGEARAMCACNQLRRATRAMTQIYDATMAPSGLTVTQLPILTGLGMAGDLPITTLAEALGLDRTTLTRNLRVLEGHGLVSVAQDANDARVRLVSLTIEGSSVLAEALERWQDAQRAVEERFGGQRLRSLYGELNALSDGGTRS